MILNTRVFYVPREYWENVELRIATEREWRENDEEHSRVRPGSNRKSRARSENARSGRAILSWQSWRVKQIKCALYLAISWRTNTIPSPASAELRLNRREEP
jgi:hypothetical protein